MLMRLAVAALLLAALSGMRAAPLAAAASASFSQTELRPLGELLNPDGGLNLSTGFRGALDPTGWRMDYAPDGAPLFQPAAVSEPPGTWHALGSGLNGPVLAIVVEAPNVYVGGDFTDAGGEANADGIARWDGSSWNGLGSGLNNVVWAIAVEGPNVYVGGGFTDAGGDANADRIARWGPPHRVYLPLVLRSY